MLCVCRWWRLSGGDYWEGSNWIWNKNEGFSAIVDISSCVTMHCKWNKIRILDSDFRSSLIRNADVLRKVDGAKYQRKKITFSRHEIFQPWIYNIQSLYRVLNFRIQIFPSPLTQNVNKKSLHSHSQDSNFYECEGDGCLLLIELCLTLLFENTKSISTREKKSPIQRFSKTFSITIEIISTWKSCTSGNSYSAFQQILCVSKLQTTLNHRLQHLPLLKCSNQINILRLSIEHFTLRGIGRLEWNVKSKHKLEL